MGVKNPLCNYSGDIKELQAGDTLPGGGGSTSVTTKGDLQGYDTAANRIPVGSDSQGLVADSSQALGVKWANRCTIYSVTALDANNTASTIDILSISVPANTWNDGESIFFWYIADTKQNSGGSITLTGGGSWNGNTGTCSVANTISNATAENVNSLGIFVTRVGTTLYFSFSPFGTSSTPINPFAANSFPSSVSFKLTGQSFSSTATLTFSLKWASANSLAFYKILGASAYKI